MTSLVPRLFLMREEEMSLGTRLSSHLVSQATPFCREEGSGHTTTVVQHSWVRCVQYSDLIIRQSVMTGTVYDWLQQTLSWQHSTVAM